MAATAAAAPAATTARLPSHLMCDASAPLSTPTRDYRLHPHTCHLLGRLGPRVTAHPQVRKLVADATPLVTPSPPRWHGLDLWAAAKFVAAATVLTWVCLAELNPQISRMVQVEKPPT